MFYLKVILFHVVYCMQEKEKKVLGACVALLKMYIPRSMAYMACAPQIFLLVWEVSGYLTHIGLLFVSIQQAISNRPHSTTMLLLTSFYFWH